MCNNSIVEVEEFKLFDELTVVLFYQTLCGTCDVAETMLEVLAKTLDNVHFIKINANFCKDVLETNEITSVPYIMIIKNGAIKEGFSAFHSVPYLYKKINVYN